MLKSVWIIVKNAFKEDVENSYAKVWRLIINSGINLSTHNGTKASYQAGYCH